MAEKESVKKFESKNDVRLIGTLIKKDINSITTKNNVPMLLGRVTLEVAEGERHVIQFMALKTFSSGKENKLYGMLAKLRDEAVSLEEANEGEKPTKLNISASFEPNVYKNQQGQEVETIQLQGRYISFVTEIPEDNNDIIVSGVVASQPIAEVGKDEEETGRHKLSVLLFNYQNVAYPIEFTLPEEAADFVEELEMGQTVELQGKNINRFIVTEVKQETEKSFGGGIVNTKRDVVRELLCLGANIVGHYDEDEDNPKVVPLDQIKEGKKNYDKWKSEQLARIEQKEQEKQKTGFTNSSKKSTAKKVAKSSSDDISDEDLPF